ncbi:MAG: endonuclease/exonuclease/phosphatase family protein [Planctomycetaceae bacterium]
MVHRLPRSLWYAACLTALVVGAIVAGRRVPLPATSGDAVRDLPDAAEAHLPRWKVAVWNIHSGKGRDERRDLERVGRELVPFDLVGLNEVRGATPLSGWDMRGLNQAAQLGRQLGVGWMFLPYESRFGVADFGNGLLTRTPVGGWVCVPLPSSSPSGHGNLSVLTVSALDQPVRVLLTHVDRDRDRLPQLREVVRTFEELPPPAILMGDLNTTAVDPLLAPLLADEEIVNPFAGQVVPTTAGRGQIDWILVKGLQVRDAGWNDTGASDHPLLWVELSPKSTASGPAPLREARR